MKPKLAHIKTVSPAPPSHRSPSRLASPQPYMTLREFIANTLPFISPLGHRAVDHSPHPEKSDHRSASTCFGRLLDPRQYNIHTHVASVKPNVTRSLTKSFDELDPQQKLLVGRSELREANVGEARNREFATRASSKSCDCPIQPQRFPVPRSTVSSTPFSALF